MTYGTYDNTETSSILFGECGFPGEMSSGGAPVSLEFCHRDASAVVSIPVALNFGFAVNLTRSF